MKNNGVKAIFAATLLVGGAIEVTPAKAVELAINGDFSSGLTGWTDFQTPNGTDDNGAVAYDVTGAGSSAALRMYNVGNTGSAGPGGGGVFQLINIAGSSDVNVTFSADYAAVIGGDTAGNLSGGIFSLIIDGVVTNSGPPVIIDGGKVANTDTGAIRYHEVHRGSLSYQGTLAAGSHRIGLLSTRDFGSTTELSQYWDNVKFDASVPATDVPEPETFAMMFAGLAGLGFVRRRKAT